ncbi:hypothetical protein Q3G72_023146 [Acer saccharum]|nr:hypothetical protein Q3G72_023146 [Acer saccharum]
MRKAGLGNIAALINKDIGQTFQKSKRKFVDINDEVDWIEKTKHAMTLHLGSIKSCSFPFDIHPWVLHLLTLLSLIQITNLKRKLETKEEEKISLKA